MSNNKAIVWLLAVFVALFFLQHNSHIKSEIGGANHGEQATHLSIAEGFVNNNLNFFYPQTLAQNYRADNYRSELSRTGEGSGITAAHFPIHAYIPAVIQKTTGGNLLSIVKWYNIIYGFIGLLFLYLLALRITNHIGKSLFVVVFVATAPVFAFYQSNVMPEIPSLANAFIGTYLIHSFLTDVKGSKPWLGLVFLLFAALSTPFYFFILISGIFLVLRKYRKDGKLNTGRIIKALLILSPLVVSEIYFSIMVNNYGSQFPVFLDIWDPEQSIRNDIINNWKMHYFTVFQSVFIAILIIIGSIQLRKNILNKSNPRNHSQILMIPALGVLAAVILYPIQLVTNDVFFLQALVLPLALLLIVFIDRLNISILDRFPKLLYPATLILLFVLIGEGNWTQTVRHEKIRTGEGNSVVFNYQGSSELLARHKVSKEVKIGVLVEPNTGTGHQILSELNREGWIIEFPKRDSPLDLIEEYAVCDSIQMRTMRDLYNFEFEFVGTNGTINLIRRTDQSSN